MCFCCIFWHYLIWCISCCIMKCCIDQFIEDFSTRHCIRVLLYAAPIESHKTKYVVCSQTNYITLQVLKPSTMTHGRWIYFCTFTEINWIYCAAGFCQSLKRLIPRLLSSKLPSRQYLKTKRSWTNILWPHFHYLNKNIEPSVVATKSVWDNLLMKHVFPFEELITQWSLNSAGHMLQPIVSSLLVIRFGNTLFS